jgi:hypothetical protein
MDNIQILVDVKYNLTVHNSISCSLQNAFKLMFVYRRDSCTKILTPPFLRDCRQNLAPRLY